MPVAKVLYDNAVRRQTLLEGVKQDSAAKFIKFLQAMDKDLRLKLTEDLTNFSQSRINAQIAAIAQSQADIIDSFLMDYEKTINNVAGTEASLEKKALDSAILNKGFEAAIPDSKQIIAAVNKDPFSLRGKGNGITLKPFLEAYKTDQIELIRGRITQGFAEGETTSQILQSLRGTKARNYADGILSTIDKNTKTMVRTSLQNVSSAARQAVWEENSDIVESVEWVSVLDARTTEQCFPAETLVSSIGELKKVFRAEYSGEFITITTASGKQITGTPNHPILTPSGFLPLHEINPSQHVVYSIGSNRSSINGNKNIGMISNIGEVFNSFSKKSGVDVFSKSASTADFYGDGVGVNNKIDIISTKCKLGNDFKAMFFKGVKDKFFSIISWFSSLPTFCGFFNLLYRWHPVRKASKIPIIFVKNAINKAFVFSGYSGNFARPSSFIKHGKDFRCNCNSIETSAVTRDIFHNSGFFEKCGNCGGSCSVSSTDFSGTNATPIHRDNVVSVSSEFRKCHVYTLNTSLGVYIAGGIIVKNCQALDGEIFPIDSGPRPPIHYNCRSTIVPVLPEDLQYLEKGAKRPSKGADGVEIVSAKTTYYDWLKTQPDSFQDHVLGVGKAEIFRGGELSTQEFREIQLKSLEKPVTLAEMERIINDM